jgi:hypothetical protein
VSLCFDPETLSGIIGERDSLRAADIGDSLKSSLSTKSSSSFVNSCQEDESEFEDKAGLESG